jgi:polysaccharide biosynthesis protein PslH
MKILWMNSRFLHPTNTGGQIRTLGILRELHRRHEVHYVALEDQDSPEGLRRSSEYCTRAYPVSHRAPSKCSPAFLAQVAASVFSHTPLAISRFHSPTAAALLARLMHQERFDRVVCDFLAPSSHFPDMGRCVLFQHNVETVIWQRYRQTAPDPLRGLYFRLQAARMFAYERDVCRRAGQIIAVSETDAAAMREMFGATRVSVVPTGVDAQFFAPPDPPAPASGLVFAGSMDWPPNQDGVLYFAREILPLIRRVRPSCRVTIVGRNAPPSIAALGREDPDFIVTGTVPDIRPHLWNAAVSIVPLRVGGGTRLKIYEAMAAGVPVVSTAIGAEGLDVRDGENIAIADEPAGFAGRCLELLNNEEARRRMAAAGRDLVCSRFSWERVGHVFEQLLDGSATAAAGGKGELTQ